MGHRGKPPRLHHPQTPWLCTAVLSVLRLHRKAKNMKSLGFFSKMDCARCRIAGPGQGEEGTPRAARRAPGMDEKRRRPPIVHRDRAAGDTAKCPTGARQCPHPLPPCPPTYANAKNLKPSTHSGRVSEAFTASSLRGQNRALLLWGLPPRQTVLSPPDPGHRGCPVSGVAWSVGPRATSRWQPTPWLSVPAPHMCPQPD